MVEGLKNKEVLRIMNLTDSTANESTPLVNQVIAMKEKGFPPYLRAGGCFGEWIAEYIVTRWPIRPSMATQQLL